MQWDFPPDQAKVKTYTLNGTQYTANFESMYLDPLLKEEGISKSTGHKLYSGLDPVQAVKEIGKLLKDGKDVSVELGQLGKKFYTGKKIPF